MGDFPKSGHILESVDETSSILNMYFLLLSVCCYILFVVPAIYHVPDVVITDSSGRERNIDLLDAEKNYAINMRNERWNEQFKVLFMVYRTAPNRWIPARTKLKHVFHNHITDNVKVDVTQVAVVLVTKVVDGLSISYVSPAFSLLNRDPTKMCVDWLSQENKRFNGTTIPSQSCPCTLREAKEDSNYVDDIYCSSLDVHYFWKAENCRKNKGAYHCMIIKQLM